MGASDWHRSQDSAPWKACCQLQGVVTLEGGIPFGARCIRVGDGEVFCIETMFLHITGGHRGCCKYREHFLDGTC